MPQYAEYALITRNLIKYAGIKLKIQSSEYPKILNVSDAVHKVSVQITEQLSRQTFSKHSQTFKMGCSAKRTMPGCRCMQPETFQGREGGACKTRASQ